MTTSPTAAEMLHVRLKWRPELHCLLQTSGAEGYYQIEDPLTRRFYRLGPREWDFARRLNGQQSLGEVLHQLETVPGDRRLTPNAAVQLARWLVQNQLVTLPGRLTDANLTRTPPARPLPAWLNPAFMRIPLFNPDAFLTRVLPWLRWTLGPTARIVWCVCVFAAAYEIASHWSRFTAPIATILTPHNWLYLLLVWLTLKAIHELYHGLVCKQYGGTVPQCGLALILFSPAAFVDVTSSWKFRSKWQRIYTAAAGMYAELFVASVLTLVWSRLDQGLLSQLCHNAMVMASVSTLLFNANFLMRFDGYYIFSDLLDVQNLYGQGQQFVRYLMRRFCLGLPASAPAFRGKRGVIIRAYGLASLCWRWLFYIGVILTSATMFHGAGIVIACVVGSSWIILPAARFVHYFVYGSGVEQPDRIRFLAVSCLAGVTLCGVVMLPWPGGVVTTGVVDYDPLAWVRSESSGFAETLYVTSGQQVTAASPLVMISSPDVRQQLAEVEFSIQQSEIRARMLQGEDDYTAYQIENRYRESLEEQRQELIAEVSALQVVSPIAGRVIGREVQWLKGQFVEAGTELLAIGSDARKSIVVPVPQRDVEFFLQQVGQPVRVRVRGETIAIRHARLAKVDPRATERLPHPALAAPHGGPLAITMSDDPNSPSQGHALRLAEPHFQATIDLPPAVALELHAGQLARVRLGSAGSIGLHLWETIEAWMRRKLRAH